MVMDGLRSPLKNDSAHQRRYPETGTLMHCNGLSRSQALLATCAFAYESDNDDKTADKLPVNLALAGIHFLTSINANKLVKFRGYSFFHGVTTTSIPTF